MSQQLVIDGMAFARDRRVLEGTVDVSALTRLHDLLAEISGEVRYRLEGVRGERGQSQLRLLLSGNLPLACQRCLGVVGFRLEVESLLELVPEGEELSQDELEDDSRDFLPVAGELEVASLIEDEVLLALPVSPRHEKCSLPGDSEAGERMMPFAGLAGMKGRPN